MLLVHPVQELARGIVPIAIILITGFDDPFREALSLAGAVLLIGYGLVRYFTTWYRVTADQVQIRRGLLSKKLSVAPRDRVRTVDVTAPILHRLLGLGRVVIGTGRTDTKRQHDLMLDALTLASAERLRTELLQRSPVAVGRPAPVFPGTPGAGYADYAGGVGRPGTARDGSGFTGMGRTGAGSGRPDPYGPGSYGPDPDGPGSDGTHPNGPDPSDQVPWSSASSWSTAAPVPPDQELVRLRPGWVLYAPFTLSGAVTALVILGFGWRLISEARLDPSRFALTREAIASLRRTPLWLDVVQILVGVIVVVTVLSLIGYVLAFSGFRLTRRPDGTLHIARGLITRRETTLEHRRVRGVELSEPLLLRTVRGARIIAIATGLRVGRGAERGGTILTPPSPRAVDLAVGAQILDDTTALTIPLVRHGAVATRRRFTRAIPLAAAATAVLGGLSLVDVLDAWIGAVSLVFVPLAALLAFDRARSLGHHVGGPHVVTRYGSLVRRRAVFDAEGVIGATVRSSLLQRRAGVVTVELTTAAGAQAYPVTDVATAVGWELVADVLPAAALRDL